MLYQTLEKLQIADGYLDLARKGLAFRSESGDTDQANAVKNLRKAMMFGSSHAFYLFAKLSVKGSAVITPSKEEACRCMYLAATAKHPDSAAQRELASFLLRNQASRAMFPKALELLHPFAVEGDSSAIRTYVYISLKVCPSEHYLNQCSALLNAYSDHFEKEMNEVNQALLAISDHVLN